MGQWMAQARIAHSDEFPALLADLNTMFPGDPLNECSLAAMEWLLALWITRDADAAAAWVVEKNNGRLVEFGALLARVAPGKVAAMLAGPLREGLGKGFLDSVLRTLAETNPREFLKLDAAAAGDAFTGQYARAMRVLAQTDPVAASELWLRRGAQAPGGKDALYNIVGRWIAHDAEAARRWVDALPNGEARRLAQHAWLGALAKQDPAAARRALAEMDLGDWLPGVPGGMDQPELQYPQDARMILLAARARQDFAGAVAELSDLLHALPPEQTNGQNNTAQILRRAIAEAAADALPNDPAAFFTAFTKLTASDGQPLDPHLRLAVVNSAVEKKLKTWDGPTSLGALRLLYGSAPTSDARGTAYQEMMAEHLMAKAMLHDAAGSLGIIEAMPEAARGPLAARAIGRLSESDLPTLHRAAAMIPVAQWNGSLGSRLAQWPEEFAPVLSQLPAGEATAEARAAFTNSWADRDPKAAAQWVTSLPHGAAPAAQALTKAWAEYDDTAASAWAASLPSGTARDGAAAGLAAAIAAAEPEAAWQWAASISDSAYAITAFTNVARQWGREAPPEFRAAFTTALDRAGLPAEHTAAALRALEQPRPFTQPP